MPPGCSTASRGRSARLARFAGIAQSPLLVVLIQADWTQQKLRDYFLRPLARLTNRVSPRGTMTYDWEE